MPSQSNSLLPPSVAAIAPHIHSALLISTYSISFRSLVSSPASTLLSTLPVTTAIQFTFSLLCVSPISGAKKTSGSTSSTTSGPASKGPRKSVTKSSTSSAATNTLSSRFLPTLLSLLLASTLGTCVIYFLLVTFGAPVTTHVEETWGAAAHMALLMVFPLVARNGVDGERWRGIIGCMGEAAKGAEFFGAAGAGVGAWAGAVPIPLDWDRAWQRWPVTVLTGAYIGYIVGKTLGGAVPALKVKSA